jgi:hypothetical protein
MNLLDSCRERTENVGDRCAVKDRVEDKKTNKGKMGSTSVWHPILGWYPHAVDRQIADALPALWRQLSLLWSLPVLRFVFRDVFAVTESEMNDSAVEESKSVRAAFGKTPWVGFKKFFEKKAGSGGLGAARQVHGKIKLDDAFVTSTAMCCQLYTTALRVFKENRVSILSGLCVRGELLSRIRKLLECLGKKGTCGLGQWLDALAADPHATLPIFHLLTLFCEAAAYLLT